MSNQRDDMRRLMQKIGGKNSMANSSIKKSQGKSKTTTVNASSKKRGCGCKRRKK